MSSRDVGSSAGLDMVLVTSDVAVPADVSTESSFKELKECPRLKLMEDGDLFKIPPPLSRRLSDLLCAHAI